MVLRIHGTNVGILNIYAPTTTGRRTKFWDQLAQHNFPTAEWIVSGDFNMTELPGDRSQGFNARNMTNREQNAWSRLAMRLGVEDVYYAQEYRKIGTKYFTWCRENPTPCWSRLDRYYTSAELRLKGGKYGTWPHLSHVSDHAPIFLSIPFRKRTHCSHAFFNKSLTGNEEAMDKFSTAWKDAIQFPGEHSMGTRVTVALEQVRRVSDQISKENKRKARALYTDQFKEVQEAEDQLQLDWSNLDAWSKLNAA